MSNDLKPCDELINTMWEHTNGNIYIIKLFTNVDTMDEKRYPVTVVYMGVNGKVWSRPLSDWSRSFKRLPQKLPKTKRVQDVQRNSLLHSRRGGNL